MTNVTKRKLPHGKIPFSEIRDVSVRSAVMKLNENIQSLKGQLELAQAAINELQRRA